MTLTVPENKFFGEKHFTFVSCKFLYGMFYPTATISENFCFADFLKDNFLFNSLHVSNYPQASLADSRLG